MILWHLTTGQDGRPWHNKVTWLKRRRTTRGAPDHKRGRGDGSNGGDCQDEWYRLTIFSACVLLGILTRYTGKSFFDIRVVDLHCAAPSGLALTKESGSPGVPIRNPVNFALEES